MEIGNTIEELPEDENNTLKFEMYLSEQPNIELIERFKKQIEYFIQNESIINQLSFNICDKHGNLCLGEFKFDHRMELEWLIVFGLIELTKLYNDLVIKLSDNNGDIILIEAAEHLPSWLESSHSKNRTFVYRGNIHIIPHQIDLKELHQKHQDSSMTISHVAASVIRDLNNDNKIVYGIKKINTLANSAIQSAIKDQLSGLPDIDAWLNKKFKQLDEIVSGKRVVESHNSIEKKFKESLTLNSIRAMNEDDLRTSPFSSRSSSSCSSTCSSDWVTEQEDNVQINYNQHLDDFYVCK